jgi:hypothetical protein
MKLADAIDDESQLFWDELLMHIAKVVNHGGFCGATNFPISSSMVIESARKVGANVLRYVFTVGGVDPGLWRVIVGLFMAASECSFRIQHFDISTISPGSNPLLDIQGAFALPYPTCPGSLEFTVERAEVSKATVSRLVQIRFRTPPADDVVTEVVSVLMSWDELLMGGFPDTGSLPQESACDATEAYLVDSLTIEHPLPNYIGSESAFDVVIAMAAWVHAKRQPVEAVLID